MLLNTRENGLNLVVEKDAQNGSLRLVHFSPLPYDPAVVAAEDSFPMVEVQCSGNSLGGVHGGKHVLSAPGGSTGLPVYVSHRDCRNTSGRRLEFVQTAGELKITSVYQFFDNIPVVRCWTELENTGIENIPLEYVSSFALTGITGGVKPESCDSCRIGLPHNSWMQEMQWRFHTLPELGMTRMSSSGYSFQRIAAANTGSYAAKELIPMGCFENPEAGTVMVWQIETHGSWAWEISEVGNHCLYLHLSGPTERENHWFKKLLPGEVFVSVPVAVAMSHGDACDGFRKLNEYRRRIRRPNADNRDLPVFFNDYMNCLMADPTTAKELPLIDRAASLGAEYYVIDAGWYSDGPWWDTIGEWLPDAPGRFPGGLLEVIDHIRTKGMKPGLWLEIERMGRNCPLASQWPDECFFCRHGRRVMESNSYQLDFRHPIVRRHADATVDRLVAQMGIKFFKIDYNIEIGPGTEVSADSFGDGLLQHQCAYLDWLDGVLARHEGLVIESCSSGGMRNTYSMLSRLSIASTTDNQNYLDNARISINSAAAFCMEQAGVWSYPLAEAGEEEVIMNMVSALSWRPYLSGQIWALSEEKLNLIREGVRLYQNELRQMIPTAEPVWPLGLVKRSDSWGAFGLRSGNEIILSVWHFDGGPETIELSFAGLDIASTICIYPQSRRVELSYQAGKDKVIAALPNRTARIYRLVIR